MDTYTINCHALELQSKAAALSYAISQSRHGVVDEDPAAATRLNMWVRLELQVQDHDRKPVTRTQRTTSPHLHWTGRHQTAQRPVSAPAIQVTRQLQRTRHTLMAATPIQFELLSRDHRSPS